MDSNQDLSGNDTESLTGEALESLGESPEAMNEGESNQESSGNENNGESLAVQKRIKQLKRAHDREMREMQSRMDQMQSQSQPNQSMQQQSNSPNESQGNPGSIEDAIHKAVGFALQQKDMEERKQKDMQNQQDIQNQYQEFQKHLDSTSDKYDDFDDVVLGNAPFTEPMRDVAALILPKTGAGSAGEVLYKLGKNSEELSRIAKLPSHKQAAELVALSHALIAGGDHKSSANRPLGNIKSNPVVNSVGVTEKTPVSDIRSRMKEGKFK
jgi:hypothetical protein